MVLVVTDVSIIAIEDLSHLEDTSRGSELVPVPFRHFWNSINSDTVEVIGCDKPVDPARKLISNPVVFMFQVGQACESAVLNLPLVVPVIDATL